MSSSIISERKQILSELTEYYNDQRCIIRRGGARHATVPFELYEALVEVCSILLLVGDAFGYIAVRGNGDIDVARSFAPFLEHFNVCVEVAQIWRVSYCPVRQYGRIESERRCKKILMRFTPSVNVKIADAVFPHLATLGRATRSTSFCHDLKWMFLNTSQSAIGYARQGIHGRCRRNLPGYTIGNAELLFSTRRCNKTDSEFARKVQHPCNKKILMQGSFMAMKALAQMEENNSSEAKINLQGYSPREVALHSIRTMLRKHDALVSNTHVRRVLLKFIRLKTIRFNG